MTSQRRPAVFIGREGELARIEEGWKNVAAVLVLGSAGMGKSSLLRALGAQAGGPVVLTALGEHRTLAEAVHAALSALQAKRSPEGEADWRLLAARLAQRRATWLIDDLDTFGPAAARLFAQVAGAIGAGRVGATSGERLSLLPGEPERLELVLGPLDEPALRRIWHELNCLYRRSSGLEQALERCHGNPRLLHRIHGAIEGIAADSSHSQLSRLSVHERRVGQALALASIPLPRILLERAFGKAKTRPALARLHRDLVIDIDAEGMCQIEPQFQDEVLGRIGTERRLEIRKIIGPHAARYFENAAEPLLARGSAADLRTGIQTLVAAPWSIPLANAWARSLLHGPSLAGAVRDLERRAAKATSKEQAAVRWAAAQAALLGGHLEDAERQLELARAVHSPAGVRPLVLCALAQALRGHGAEARRMLDSAMRTAGSAAERTCVAFCQALCFGLEASYEEAEVKLCEALCHETSERTTLVAAVYMPLLRAWLLAERGHHGEAQEQLAAVRQRQDRGTDPHSMAWIELVEARLLEAREARLAALAAFERAAASFERRGEKVGLLLCRIHAGRLHLLLGHRRVGWQLLDAAKASAISSGLAALQALVQSSDGFDPMQQMWRAEPMTTGGAVPGGAARLRLVRALKTALSGLEQRAAIFLHGFPEGLEGEDYAMERVLGHLAVAALARVQGRTTDADQARDAAAHAAVQGGVDADMFDLLARLLGHVRLIGRTSRRVADRPTRDLSAYACVLDGQRHELRAGEKTHSLRALRVLRRLLYALASRPGQVIRRHELAAALWTQRYHAKVHDNPLKANIFNLKSFVRQIGMEIVSEKEGYRLIVPPGFLFIERLPR